MNTDIFSLHGFELDSYEQDMFQKFLLLFIAYNSHTNLSAIREEGAIIEKHFIDSLMGAQAIHNPAGKLLDIGSGGGFPGIPLGIVFPDMKITLLDSVGKKVKAMQHFVSELGLTNIHAIQERAEVLAKDPKYSGQYDVVVSRATAYMTSILTWATPFLKKTGKIILYKMPSEDEQHEIHKITKKLGLILEGELPYELGEKKRILYIFSKK